MTFLRALIRDECGGPAAEMALSLPMLMALLFGGMEGGNFFWREHQVVKAAREGARFAGRQALTGFDCTNNTIDTAKVDLAKIQAAVAANLVQTPTVTVTVRPCIPRSNRGIYAMQVNGAPIVVVRVEVPYQGLFSSMILGNDLTLNATSQAAVVGI